MAQAMKQAVLAKPAVMKKSPWQSFCVMLRKSFVIDEAIRIQENICITPLSETKIGVSFKYAIDLSEQSKVQLRKCLKLAYGHHTKIIAMDMPKQEKEETAAKVEARPSIELKPAESKWQEIQEGILNSGLQAMESWLELVNVISLSGRTLKLEATSLVCRRLENGHSVIESIAAEQGADLVIKNMTYGETLYFPWIKEKHGFFNG